MRNNNTGGDGFSEGVDLAAYEVPTTGAGTERWLVSPPDLLAAGPLTASDEQVISLVSPEFESMAVAYALADGSLAWTAENGDNRFDWLLPLDASGHVYSHAAPEFAQVAQLVVLDDSGQVVGRSEGLLGGLNALGPIGADGVLYGLADTEVSGNPQMLYAFDACGPPGGAGGADGAGDGGGDPPLQGPTCNFIPEGQVERVGADDVIDHAVTVSRCIFLDGPVEPQAGDQGHAQFVVLA